MKKDVVTKPLVSGMMFSVSPNFVFKKVVVTKPPESVIVFPVSNFFSINFFIYVALIYVN